MKNITAGIAVLGLVSLLGSACLVAVMDYSASGESPEEEVNRTLPFPAGETLSLSNFDGEISITGWEEEHLDVFASIWGPQVNQTSIGFIRRKAPVLPRVEIDDLEDEVRIRTLAPKQAGEDVTVDYDINVPHSARLKDIVGRDGRVDLKGIYGDVTIELRIGEILVEEFSGSLTASLMEGNISADLYDLREKDRIHLKLREGNMTVILDPDANVRLEGYCPEGKVTTDYEFDEEPGQGRFASEFGDGGAVINLAVLKGDLRIERRR